jgi:signal transduction histidine kinase
MAPQQRARFLANIEGDARRMERLVQRLLELARIQNAPEASREIEIRPFVERIVARYPSFIELDLAHSPGAFSMNPDHLESALRNLLDNAVRHAAGRRVALSVRGTGTRVEFRRRRRRRQQRGNCRA